MFHDLKISRPGLWFPTIWIYLVPFSLETSFWLNYNFWIGLFFVTFPLNYLVYGLNDYNDFKADEVNSRKGNSYFLFIELMDDSLFICDKMCSQAIELNFPKDKDKVLIETEYIRLEGYPINYLKIGPDKSKNDKTGFIIPFNMIRNRDATILEDFLKSYGLTRNSDSEGDFNWFGLFKSQSPSEAS